MESNPACAGRRGFKVLTAVPQSTRRTAPPTYVELVAPRSGGIPAVVVELEGPRGRMRIEFKGVATAELVALSRALWDSGA